MFGPEVYSGKFHLICVLRFHEHISLKIFTCICSAQKGIFPPGQGATIGVDFMIKTVEIDGLKIKVNAY